MKTSEICLSQAHGISLNDAAVLLAVARACGKTATRRVQPIDIDVAMTEAEVLTSILWLAHRKLVLVEDFLGVLYVFAGDVGRSAIKLAHREARAARRAA